jgi:hypothetical protein
MMIQKFLSVFILFKTLVGKADGSLFGSCLNPPGLKNFDAKKVIILQFRFSLSTYYKSLNNLFSSQDFGAHIALGVLMKRV